MTVNSASFFDRSSAQMTRLSNTQDLLSTQISTGKKLQAPSDAPLSYSRLRGLATQGADATAYAGNLKLADATLSSADTALAAMTAQLTRARELTTQASTGTLSAANRAALGEEMAGIVQTLASLANGSDTQGHPLFGDTSGAAALTANDDGTYSYATGTAPTMPIGDGQTIATSVTAGALFAAGGGDTLKMLGDLATTLKAGGTVPADALTNIQAAANVVDTARSSVGARAARVDVEQASQTSAATERETLRSGLEDTDVTQAITELQKTMTTLQATQASFTKLSSLSLFDYLK